MLPPGACLRDGPPMMARIRELLAPGLAHLRQMQVWVPLLIGAGLLVGLSYTALNLSWLVPMGMLAGVFGTLFFFSRPELVLLMFFVARIWLDMLWWIPGRIAGLNLLAAFTGGATLLSGLLFALEFRRIERHPNLNAFLVFAGVLFLSAIRNLNAAIAVELMARFISPPLLMFLVGAFLTRHRDAVRLMMFLYWACFVALMVSMYYLVTNQLIHFDGYRRLLGAYKNLRHHGMMMMLMASIAVFWFYRFPQQRMKIFTVGYIGAAAVCMYMTYIRTSLLAFVAFVAAFLYVTRRRQELSVAIAVGVLGILLSPEIQDRFKDLILVFTIDEDLFLQSRKLGSGRIGLWTDSFKEYLQQPLGDIVLGLGLGGHWKLTQAAYNPFIVVQGGQVDTHSDYLGLLYQLGPIALFAYLYMQFKVFIYGFSLARDAQADSFSRDLGGLAAALAIGVLVTNVVSNGFINRTTLGWLFWGIGGLMFATHARHHAALAEKTSGATPLHPKQAVET
ncbi:MAG: O-antigen ligase family protein [Myxococcota bacterium]